MEMQAVSTAFWSDPDANGVDVRTAFPNGKVVSITFVNQGTATVTVGDNLKLVQDRALMIGCEAGMYDCTFYKIAYGPGSRDLVVMAQILKG